MLSKTSLRSKIEGGFIIVLTLLALVAAVATWAISSLRSSSDILATQSLKQIQFSKQLQANVINADDAGAWSLLAIKPADATTYQNQYQQAVQSVAQTETAIRTLPLTADQSVALATFDTQWAAYLKGNDGAFALFHQGEREQAQASYIDVPFTQILQAVDSYVAKVNASVDQQRQSAQTTGSLTLILVLSSTA